ncbi:MAG: retroviral-like aspartic protease family protein [Blastocatellia bacterium]
MKERNKSKFLACATVLLGGICAFASAQTSAASTVKFKLLRGYVIVIPVTVNGAGPYEFLLDTGTNTTLVSAEFAQALRLRPIDRIELVTVAGSQIVPRAQLASVAVGAKSAANVEALFSDLREVRALKPEICGVLGMNFLAQFNYLINYRERRIEFEDDVELENSLSGERLPLECNEGRAIVLARSARKESWRLALDSGISNLLLFAADWRDLKLDWAQGESQRLLARTDVGSQGVWQKRLRSFQIGGASFYDLPVAVMESKVAGAGRAEDGLLPTSLFQQVYFNHRKNFVILNQH